MFNVQLSNGVWSVMKKRKILVLNFKDHFNPIQSITRKNLIFLQKLDAFACLFLLWSFSFAHWSLCFALVTLSIFCPSKHFIFFIIILGEGRDFTWFSRVDAVMVFIFRHEFGGGRYWWGDGLSSFLNAVQIQVLGFFFSKVRFFILICVFSSFSLIGKMCLWTCFHCYWKIFLLKKETWICNRDVDHLFVFLKRSHTA